MAILLGPFLKELTRLLEDGRVDSPRLSAEVLLAHALGVDRTELLKELILDPMREICPEKANIARCLGQRRYHGEPVAHLTGRREFYGRDFFVNRHTLIPRPETELIVEKALPWISKALTGRGSCLFADLGTGSGCLAVTLALEAGGAKGVAVDLSKDAIAVARQNAAFHNARNVGFVLADFTRTCFRPKSLDLIVANPPYVSESEYAQCDREVRDFEPRSALVPGVGGDAPACGLEHLRAVVELAALCLKPGGALFVEFGATQAGDVRAMCGCDMWGGVEVFTDLAGLPRMLSAYRT